MQFLYLQNDVARNTSARSVYADGDVYDAAATWERLSYLCVVELGLHIQRLQNLIENRLQTERCRLLTL